MSRPLFLLTCMRSYSSLVCGMLGQHPQLFGLPELNLFVADTLGNATTALQIIRPRSLDGLLRTIAELEFGGQSDRTIVQARFWLKERGTWSTRDVLQHIAAGVAPRRLIEKSPSTVLSAERLRRMRRMFPDAQVLHLTRHPRPTCRSIHQITSKRPTNGPQPRIPRADPEGSWFKTNLNIMHLATELPPGHYMHIRGESLLTSPEKYLRQISEWLGVDFDQTAFEAMLHPETSAFACIGPDNAPFGNDPNFLRSPRFEQREIPPASLQGPLEWDPTRHGFDLQTVEMARRFGYH